MQFRNEGNNDKLIVMIHGLMGSDDTWGEPSLYNLMLSDDKIKNNYDVALFNYYSKLNDKKGILSIIKGIVKKNLSISELSALLETKLSLYSKYNEIILIGHSMGGLIAKEYVLNNNNNVSMYISIATPHNGSSFAKFSMNHTQIKELKKGSEYLKDLNASWISFTNLPKVFYFYGLKDDIVPKDSAIPMGQSTSGIAIDEDHLSIVKPKTKENDLLKKLLNILVLHANESDFSKIVLYNCSKLEKDVKDNFSRLTEKGYNIEKVIDVKEIESIFNISDVTMELKDKDKFIEFIEKYSSKLLKNISQIKEVVFFGISLVPLSVLEGYILKNIDKRRYFLNYRQEGGFKELLDTPSSNITFNYQIPDDLTTEICLKISVSFKVQEEGIRKIYNNLSIVTLEANNITHDNIKSYSEVIEFKKKFRELLNNLKSKKVKVIHLFIGAPVCINIATGETLESHDCETLIYSYLNSGYDWALNLKPKDILKF